jgi:NADP-dependent 3-hydroxy acid dehydrogenase YdfG
MRSLQGKTAWITGAGTGIGEAGARALAAAGMHVVLSGRRIEPLNAVAEDLGDAASVEVLDVSDRNAVAAVAGRILDRHGSVDVLVNSAGINVKSRNWHNVSLDDWERIIRIDLDGAFYCIKTVLPAMIEQGDGLIINVSSWAGRHVSVVTGPGYTAAKHAMNAMNESVNMEHGIHGIRACAICPGEVATPILDNRPVPVTKEDRARMVQSEDCGDVIRFIAELPAHVCINELVISPTWNRGYIAQARTLAP